eukprot:gene10454-10262_t
MDSALQLDISLNGALATIAQIGDLSMGQPLGHSRRVAALARKLAQARHGDGEHLRVAEQVALLRWSGCTANAEGFADLLGDDVDGRRAMLDLTLGNEQMNAVHQATPLAVLGAAVEAGLCRVFETYDGTGRPLGLTHEHIPDVAYQVVLAGDLDILKIATHAYERLNGSGYFRGVAGDALCAEYRLFATSVAWVALREARPWRPAHGEADAATLLKHDADSGLFDNDVCEAVIAAAGGERRMRQPKASILTTRECRILLEISRGASNKRVAQLLDISPSTVRTHMESIFRKLECSTRAAATLKGLTLGLIA